MEAATGHPQLAPVSDGAAPVLVAVPHHPDPHWRSKLSVKVATAAFLLDVSESQVHNLLDADALQAVETSTSTAAADKRRTRRARQVEVRSLLAFTEKGGLALGAGQSSKAQAIRARKKTPSSLERLTR